MRLAGGPVVGSYILVGETEELRSDDFGDGGNLLNNPHALQTKKLLDALKAALCPNGRLIFSACYQGTGGLLQHISTYVANQVSVEGFSGFGMPWAQGDMVYKDGVRQ